MPKVIIDMKQTLPPFPFLVWNKEAISWILGKKGFDLNNEINSRLVREGAVEYTQGESHGKDEG